MPIVPENRLSRIAFYELHLPPWTASAAAIGLLPASVTALGLLVGKARTAYTEHLAAKQAAKTATATFYERVRAMHAGAGAGSDMIETIKNYAATKNDPNVYTLAEIPPPSPAGVSPPPGTPTDFSVNLLQDGSLRLAWKCANPSGTVGTIYEVKRQVGSPPGPLTFVGAIGVKTFIDPTVPSGASPVTYQVTAIRSTARGNPAQFTVSFGVGGGGGVVIAGVTQGTAAADAGTATPVKKAA